MVRNKGVIFKAVPHGWPVAGRDLAVETRSIDLEAELPKDSILTKNFYFSYDPAQRGRMRNPGIKSYVPAYTIGEPITNMAVSRVFKSASPRFKAGDIVLGRIGFEEYSLITDPTMLASVRKLENPYDLPLTQFLGALGGPGITAYGSLYEIGKPKKGETIFVSAASGAVGQIVGQLAKIEGMSVIGSVGSDEKLELIKTELRFDDGFNYKKEDIGNALTRLMPQGIDIYYDNVGGEMLDEVILRMNNFGRIGKSLSSLTRHAGSSYISQKIYSYTDSQVSCHSCLWFDLSVQRQTR
jgi:NADPH-dependent curcumin reductase CurA